MNTKHLLVFYIDEVLLGAADHDWDSAYRAIGEGVETRCRKFAVFAERTAMTMIRQSPEAHAIIEAICLYSLFLREEYQFMILNE